MLTLKKMTIETTCGLEASITRTEESGKRAAYTWTVKRPGLGGEGRRGSHADPVAVFRTVLTALFAFASRGGR